MLTAIVPVSEMSGRLHNLEDWLSAIHHIDIKVIIVHDYRDSETERQLLSILNSINSSKIIFLSGTFGSPGAARNAGLERVESKFVCFWDSDDLPNPQSIIAQLEAYKQDCDILVGQYVRSSIHAKKIQHVKSKDCSINDVAMNPGLWRMIFRRDYISSVKFQNMRMGEDQLFLAEVMTLKPRICFTRTVFYNYFVGHPSQLTQTPAAISELVVAFREILTLRKSASGIEFEFASIIVSRMSLTLARFAFLNKDFFYISRALFLPSNLITHHPYVQIKCALFVLLRLFRLTVHA
jgi:glycosyltransferase involved in cell wall biosynthesis